MSLCFVDPADAIRAISDSIGREARRQLLGEAVRAWVDEIPDSELEVHYAKAIADCAGHHPVLAGLARLAEVGQPIPNRDFLMGAFGSLGENRREALKLAAGFRGEEAVDAGVTEDDALELVLGLLSPPRQMALAVEAVRSLTSGTGRGQTTKGAPANRRLPVSSSLAFGLRTGVRSPRLPPASLAGLVFGALCSSLGESAVGSGIAAESANAAAFRPRRRLAPVPGHGAAPRRAQEVGAVAGGEAGVAARRVSSPPPAARWIATTRRRAREVLIARPTRPPPGATRAARQERAGCRRRSVASESSPSAAPTNQGAASAEVDQTWRKPKSRSSRRPSARSKTRRTTATSSQRSLSGRGPRGPSPGSSRSSLVRIATARRRARLTESRVCARVASP